MKTTLLDTSFILTCIRQKIDFFEELEFQGLKIIIPIQVIKELEGLSKKQEAKIALQLLKKQKFTKTDLKTKNVDSGIIAYANKNKKVIIATLDKEIKDKAENQKLVIRGKKKLEIR